MITLPTQIVKRTAVAIAGAFCQAGDMLRIAALVLALLASTFASSVSARDVDTWRFDPVHTQVVLFADHLGLSHGVGRLKIRSGWLRFDPDDWSRAQVDVVIDVGSLDMGDPKWTATVLSAQFLDVARWPDARYTSSSAEKTAPDRGIVNGTLELHGVRHPLALELTFNRIGRDPYAFKTKAGFSARATIDRFAFGMERYRDVVGADVELRIEVEAIRDPTAARGDAADADQEH